MPSSTYYGFQHINENVMCAIQTDMTSDHPKNKELLEVAIVPLNATLKFHEIFPLYNVVFKPEFPEWLDRRHCRVPPDFLAKTMLGTMDKDRGADMLGEWFAKMKLGRGKKIIPLCYNWALQRSRLIDWLGELNFDVIFSEDHRDILSATHIVNDRMATRHEAPTFSKQTLAWIGKQLHVEKHIHGGTPIDDCRQIAEIYQKMMLIHF
jgi:hypothetical protein